MNPIITAAIGVGGSTLVGAAIGFFVRNVSHKASDTIIGLCAGVMLSAAVLGLLQPAFTMVEGAGVLLPIVGVFTGALLLNFLDIATPHLHSITGLDPESHLHNQRIDRVLLFVMAIALHKFPEGMAAGVGFGGGAEATGDAFRVAFAICLQNVPEAMVVMSPLLLAGVRTTRATIIAAAIGALEVIGVFTGYFLGSLSVSTLPFMLALSGGAMLYVVSDEMIPESHTHGYQKQATYALLLGFVSMLLIDNL